MTCPYHFLVQDFCFHARPWLLMIATIRNPTQDDGATWFESFRNKWIVECESSCDAEIFWISHWIFGTPRQLHQNLFRIERQIQNTAGEVKKKAKRGYFQKTLEQKWAIFFDMCKRLLSLPLLINIKRFLWSFFCKHNLSLAGIRHLLLTIMPHRCPLMAIIILTL